MPPIDAISISSLGNYNDSIVKYGCINNNISEYGFYYIGTTSFYVINYPYFATINDAMDMRSNTITSFAYGVYSRFDIRIIGGLNCIFGHLRITYMYIDIATIIYS